MVRNNLSDAQTQVLNSPPFLVENSLGALDHQIVQAMLQKPVALALDCSAIQAVDSAGLNWLLAVQSRLTMQSIAFFIQAPSPILTSIFLATRLDQRLKFVLPIAPVELNHHA